MCVYVYVCMRVCLSFPTVQLVCAHSIFLPENGRLVCVQRNNDSVIDQRIKLFFLY
jgi:hypothetical protein